MKYLIASDIHGSAYYCRLLIGRIKEEDPAKVILLGDLLYHGARNPLPPEYSTLGTAELLNSVKDRLLCVAGNCDSQVDTLVLEFPIGAEYCVLPLPNGRTAILTHGHTTPAYLKKGDVLFNGHFHVPAFEERENCTYVNCGSVSIPKDGSRHSYLVLDGTELLFKDVETGEVFLRAAL